LSPLLSAPELAAAQLPARKTILDPILTSKSLAMVYGPRGLGKTFVALGIAWAAASGSSFLGWRASRPHRVTYLDGEMAADEMRQRLLSFGPPPASLKIMLSDLHRGESPDLADGYEFAAGLRQWGAPELLVIDNLASLAGFKNGNPDRWHELQRCLMTFRRLGCAVLLVHPNAAPVNARTCSTSYWRCGDRPTTSRNRAHASRFISKRRADFLERPPSP
jgi:putative DNA primase/helicase